MTVHGSQSRTQLSMHTHIFDLLVLAIQKNDSTFSQILLHEKLLKDNGYTSL